MHHHRTWLHCNYSFYYISMQMLIQYLLVIKHLQFQPHHKNYHFSYTYAYSPLCPYYYQSFSPSILQSLLLHCHPWSTDGNDYDMKLLLGHHESISIQFLLALPLIHHISDRNHGLINLYIIDLLILPFFSFSTFYYTKIIIHLYQYTLTYQIIHLPIYKNQFKVFISISYQN